MSIIVGIQPGLCFDFSSISKVEILEPIDIRRSRKPCGKTSQAIRSERVTADSRASSQRLIPSVSFSHPEVLHPVNDRIVGQYRCSLGK